MPIDYGRLISKTWEVFSRNRVLWLLGLIVALTSGSYNTSFTNQMNGTDLQDFFDRYGGLLTTLGCVAIILAIVFSFLRAAGEAALIATTDHIERTHEQPPFAAAWGLGWPKMFPVWLFNLLFGIIIAVIILILLVPVFLVFGASLAAIISAADTNSDASAAGSAFGLGCLCLCVALIILIPLGLILSFVREYGVRAVVLENEGAFQAFGTGWRLFRANLGPSLVVFLITVVVGIIVSVVLAPVLLVIGIPMVAASGLNGGELSVPTLIFLGAILWIVGAIIGAFSTSLESVLWTLLYRNLRQMPGSELAPAGMVPPGGGTPYGAAPPYSAAGGPPPYNPAGSPPPYTPPSASPPPYTPPAGSPPPYTPPPSGSETTQYSTPPYTPPAASPPPYTPAEGTGTVQYGTPPPYTPPGETRPMPPPDDRARGPEGGSGT
jgi:hypothetical protein